MKYTLLYLTILAVLLQQRRVNVHGVTCRRDSQCSKEAMCHKLSRMCVCKNRASSYPSCQIKEEQGANCDEKYHFYDTDTKECKCRYGGMTEDTCCKNPCKEFRTCDEGKCVCAYGTFNRKCRRCMEACRSDQACKKVGDKWTCVKLQCEKKCGPNSRCKLERGRLVCTQCGPNSYLALGICIKSWGVWSPWSPCSATCIGGNKIRRRTCLNSQGACVGAAEEGLPCNGDIPCPVKGWGVWSPWSPCSATCNEGSRIRTRLCQHPQGNCAGEAKETLVCQTNVACPPTDIDCGWCEWGPAKNQQVGDGQCRFQSVRTRKPDCPPAQGNGKKCEGSSLESKDVQAKEEKFTRDFHGDDPERNLFKVTCKNGCFTVTKVVHWCKPIPNVPEDFGKVKNICDGKELCQFTPAPSFFGVKTCPGQVKTWMEYSCWNADKVIRQHVDGWKRKVETFEGNGGLFFLG